MEDLDGFCATLIRAAGRDPKVTLSTLDAELKPLPKGESHRVGQVCLSPELKDNPKALHSHIRSSGNALHGFCLGGSDRRRKWHYPLFA